MGMVEMIARQYDYGCWARDKLLREARQLDDEQYFAEATWGGVGSLHSVLVHTLATEWVWRNLAQHAALSGPPPNTETLATLADLEAAWREEEAACRAFLESLDEAGLEARVETVSPAGQAYSFVRWEMMQHALLHSMQHRTEAAAVLTSHGHSPGDLDYVFFVIGRE